MPQVSDDATQWPLPEHGRIAFMHMGGLGDLVLAAGFISRLKAAFPRIHLALICRAEFASVPALFPVRPDEVVPLSFNPYAWDGPGEQLDPELSAIAAQLRGRHFDFLLDGSLAATWFSWFAAAVLRPAHAACTAGDRPAEHIVDGVLRRFASEPLEIERVTIDPGRHERERYAALAARFSNASAAAAGWALPHQAKSAARNWLASRGITEGRYIACFPGVSGHAAFRRWPERRFIDVLEQFAHERELAAVLIGGASERAELERVAAMTSRPIPVFAGEPDQIACTAGLLALSQGYLGNDSGPAHLAQAFGVPGVVIFGGGGHPVSYACWERGSIGLVHPLPCFGCGWDCVLDRGLCVESVPTSTVIDAMRRALDVPSRAAETVSVDLIDRATRDVLAQSNHRYRSARAESGRRLGVIREMKEQVRMFQRVAAERLETLERIHAEAARRERLIHDLDRAVRDSDRVAGERLTLLNSVRAEAERRAEIIIELNNRLAEMEGRSRTTPAASVVSDLIDPVRGT